MGGEGCLTLDGIDRMLGYLGNLRDPEVSTGTWEGGERDESGVIHLPWLDWSPWLAAFVRDAYDTGFISSFDWLEWQETAIWLYEHPEHLAVADLDTLRRLVTTHVRKDRFCEGHLAEMVEGGHIRAIFERLAAIRAALPPGLVVCGYQSAPSRLP